MVVQVHDLGQRAEPWLSIPNQCQIFIEKYIPTIQPMKISQACE